MRVDIGKCGKSSNSKLSVDMKEERCAFYVIISHKKNGYRSLHWYFFSVLTFDKLDGFG